VAVDPIEFEREKAMEFGAIPTFASMEEAFPVVMERTEGTIFGSPDHGLTLRVVVHG